MGTVLSPAKCYKGGSQLPQRKNTFTKNVNLCVVLLVTLLGLIVIRVPNCEYTEHSHGAQNTILNTILCSLAGSENLHERLSSSSPTHLPECSPAKQSWLLQVWFKPFYQWQCFSFFLIYSSVLIELCNVFIEIVLCACNCFV